MGNEFFTELLGSKHNKSSFTCGKYLLDNYLQKQAGQDLKRKLAVCYVLNEHSIDRIKGYYTLSNSSIHADWIPSELRKKLPPSYNAIPTTLIGRLAIDSDFQGKGLGKLLLVDALKRCFELSVLLGSFAVIVDPIDLEAELFYKKYGFIKLPDSGKMFLPMRTIEQLFEQ
jgi:GNAT superfamily N-acetyltransferase